MVGEGKEGRKQEKVRKWRLPGKGKEKIGVHGGK